MHAHPPFTLPLALTDASYSATSRLCPPLGRLAMHRVSFKMLPVLAPSSQKPLEATRRLVPSTLTPHAVVSPTLATTAVSFTFCFLLCTLLSVPGPDMHTSAHHRNNTTYPLNSYTL